LAAVTGVAAVVIVAILIVALVARRGDAAQVLLEGDAGLFGGAGRVGIEGVEKVLDLLMDLRIRRDDLAWLDLVVHFRLHSQSSPEQFGLSVQAATHIGQKHVGGG
jgi:hypothetical protein